jgi:hypothetical protein
VTVAAFLRAFLGVWILLFVGLLYPIRSSSSGMGYLGLAVATGIVAAVTAPAFLYLRRRNAAPQSANQDH